MATYSIDMIRHNRDIEGRFLVELDDAVRVLESLGYDRSTNLDELSKYYQAKAKRDMQSEKVAALNAELMGPAR